MASIGITGNTNSGEEIGIRFPASITPGTYTIGNTLTTSTFAYYDEPFDDNETLDGVAESGTLVITKHDVSNKIIEGTFSFTTNDEGILSEPVRVWNITEGSFRVVYSDL